MAGCHSIGVAAAGWLESRSDAGVGPKLKSRKLLMIINGVCWRSLFSPINNVAYFALPFSSPTDERTISAIRSEGKKTLTLEQRRIKIPTPQLLIDSRVSHMAHKVLCIVDTELSLHSS